MLHHFQMLCTCLWMTKLSQDQVEAAMAVIQDDCWASRVLATSAQVLLYHLKMSSLWVQNMTYIHAQS